MRGPTWDSPRRPAAPVASSHGLAAGSCPASGVRRCCPCTPWAARGGGFGFWGRVARVALGSGTVGLRWETWRASARRPGDVLAEEVVTAQIAVFLTPK